MLYMTCITFTHLIKITIGPKWYKSLIYQKSLPSSKCPKMVLPPTVMPRRSTRRAETMLLWSWIGMVCRREDSGTDAREMRVDKK